MMGILRCRLMAVIQFHDTIHGLSTGRGTSTTSLEENLIQQLMAMREEFLYDIVLYLHKDYDAPDCGRCLYILAA